MCDSRSAEGTESTAMTSSRKGIFSKVLLLLFGLVSVQAYAATELVAEQVRARLIPSVAQVYPGEEIEIGLQQKIIPHWHTYWKNSGDSGSPTTMEWVLPKGGSAGPIQWPVPERYTLGPVTNYGYAKEVTLLSRVRIPADAPVGSKVPV